MKRIALALAIASAAACRGGAVHSPAAAEQPGDVRETVATADLPEPVMAAVRSHQRASLASAAKISRGGRIVFYDLRLTGTRKTHLVVEPDGHVLTFE